MTEIEARQQLKELKRISCTCGCERLRVFYHSTKPVCSYRIAALSVPEEYRGSLYTEELPEAA